MTLTIAATPDGDALTLSGDVCSILPLPADRCKGSVVIGLSDGTLLEASLSRAVEERFRVAREGAAITVVQPDQVEVQWPIEWLTVSGLNHALAIQRDPEPLPLFPEAA